VITGTVNADREAVIRIRVHDVNGQEQEFAAIVDTGFTGRLTLPPDVIAALGLPWKELGAAILADGSQVLFDVYEATIVWDGQVIAISVYEANSEPLIGMTLMNGFHIHIKDLDGGLVQIERI
jgi:clan AA aspartic protease